MPRTFAVLQQDVANYVQAPDDAEALSVAGSGINDAIRMLNGRNWTWQDTSYTFAITASTQNYALPDDFKSPRQLNLMNTAGELARRVGYEEPKIFDTRFNRGESATSTDGTPYHYTVRDPYVSGQLTFDVTPDSSTVTTYPSGVLRYYARIPELTSQSQELVVPPEVEYVITWAAKSMVAAIYDPQKVGYAESRWQPQLRQLRRNESEQTDWRKG